MPLEPGQLDSANEWTSPDALAPYIEAELRRLDIFSGDDPANVMQGRRLALLGIAAGIITYLKSHNVNFHLDVPSAPYLGSVTIL